MADPVLTPLRRYTCKLTKADYEALLKRFDARPVSLSLILACAVLGGLAWGMVEPEWFGDLALLPVIAAGAIILYGLVHLWRNMRRAQKVARWTPPAEPVEVEEFGDHLAVRENGKNRYYAWEAIASVAMDDERVYLVNSRDDFVIMPLAAFESREDMSAFTLACNERMREPEERDSADADAAPVPARITPEAEAASTGRAARNEVAVTLTQDDAPDVEEALRRPGAGRTFGFATGAAIAGLAGGAIGGGLVWGLASWLEPQPRLFAGALAAWIGAMVLTFLGARRIEGARAAQWPADDPRRRTRRFEIDEAGFAVSGAEFETRIAWAGVESIRETERHVLFITRWKEIYAVPKRCFADADAGHAFANKARSFKKASCKTGS